MAQAQQTDLDDQHKKRHMMIESSNLKEGMSPSTVLINKAKLLRHKLLE